MDGGLLGMGHPGIAIIFAIALHVYLLLHLQRAARDPILSHCTNTQGNTIESLYYSMYMYCHGGRMHVE